MKIVVIGNCQARPIAALLAEMRPDFDVTETIIVQHSNAASEEVDNRTFNTVDAIFAQLTSDTFQPAHLATAQLRRCYGAKVIVWPNIFFAGQQPYLRYFTNRELGRVYGPYQAMHDLRLFRSWLRTGRVDPNSVLTCDRSEVDATRSESLRSLAEKETMTDVTVSDLIRDRHEAQPLFFTFNHPRRVLIAEVAQRLLVKAGLPPARQPAVRPELLGRYLVPGIDTEEALQGDTIDGKVSVFTLPEVCAAFQAVYDANPGFRNTDGIRLTPEIGWERSFLART